MPDDPAAAAEPEQEPQQDAQPEPEEEPIPTSGFEVTVHSLAVDLAPATDPDQPPAQVYASVFLSRGAAKQRWGDFWDAAPDAADLAAAIAEGSTPADWTATTVARPQPPAAGNGRALDWTIRSRPVPLTEEAITSLVDAVVTVQVFRGESFDPATDTLLATVEQPLRTLIDCDPVRDVEFAFGGEPSAEELEARAAERAAAVAQAEADGAEPPAPEPAPLLRRHGASSHVRLTVELDPALQDYILGGHVLQLRTGCVTRVPPEWTEGADPHGASPLEFAAHVDVPTGQLHLARGQLVFHPDEEALRAAEEERARAKAEAEAAAAEAAAAAAAEAEAAEEKVEEKPKKGAKKDKKDKKGGAEPAAAEEEPEEEAPIVVPGHWTVEWAAGVREATSAWMHRDTMDAWRQRVDDAHSPLLVKLERMLAPEDTDSAESAAADKKTKKGGGAKAEKKAAAAAESSEPTNPMYTLELASLTLAGQATIDDLVLNAGQDVFALVPAELAVDGDPDDVDDHEAGEHAQVLAAGMAVEVQLHISPPPVPAAAPPLEPRLRPADVIPTRPHPPLHPPRDACLDLRKEVAAVVATVAGEYSALFDPASEYADPAAEQLPPEERRRRLLYTLNSSGQYQQFKEQLKRNVVRVVRERFPECPSPDDAKELDKLYSRIYVYLMGVVNEAATAEFQIAEGARLEEQPRPGEPGGGTGEREVERHATLAREAEAVDRVDQAHVCHKNAITEAEASGWGTLRVWFDYGCFCLRQGDRAKAGECFQQALSLDPAHADALALFAAILVEAQRLEQAEIYLNALMLAQTGESLSPREVPGAAGRTVQTYAPIELAPVRTHMMLCLFFDAKQRGAMARAQLRAAIASAERDGQDDVSAVDLLLDFAQHLLAHHMRDLAARALELALGAEAAAGRKPLPQHRLLQRVTSAEIAFRDGDINRALSLATQSTQLDKKSGKAWLVMGDVQMAQGNTQGARASYSYALSAFEGAGLQVPLRLFLRLGGLSASDPAQAKEVFLRCAAAYPVCSAWLGVGVACLRLEAFDEAEEALSEANVLDNFNAEVWGYLALLCLSVAPPRLEECSQALEQALRLELDNAALLRDLGTAFVGIDDLRMAERLFRRSLAVQDAVMTRRRLADVLTAQQSAQAALDEYTAALEATSLNDADERADLVAKCASALTTLGRTEEIAAYEAMLVVPDNNSAASLASLGSAGSAAADDVPETASSKAASPLASP